MAYTAGKGEERNVLTFPAKAGAAISPYRIVKKGTDPDEVIQATAGTDCPEGISGNGAENNAATYVEHDPMAVKCGGAVYVKMAGSGVRDDRVMSDANACGIRHVNTDGVWVIGIATKAWSDGDIIPVEWNRQFIGDYTQS